VTRGASAAVLATAALACAPEAPGPVAPTTVASGTAQGSAPVDGDEPSLVGGLAYFDSPAHRGRVVVRLTTWTAADCAVHGDGLALEVPVDDGNGTWRSSWWDCTEEACATIDHPLTRLTLTAVGNGIGERIEGAIDVLDADDQVVGSVVFDVPYCGPR